MADHSANNKRIAKNTMMLYVRMLFSMLVSLYTSRVILQTLGVEDYGIYNVVGGVVSMFSMISGSLSSAISRFMTFELGRGDKQKLKTVFSTSITIQVIISFIVVVLAEIIGVWFLNNKMVIPADRLEAANWIFQFSLVTFVVGLISVPYNAAIIAHEKMKAFAYIGILEVLAKLGIVFSLMVAPIDKLIFYGLLLMLLSLVIRIVYGIYCKRNFEECTYCFVMDKPLLKEMFGFAGWNYIGASSVILRDQGGDVLLNVFGGAVLNAARGIAMQINGVVSSFVGNFMMAINPQITKSYATKEYDYMMKLVFKSARYSFYLLLILSLPVIINSEYILRIWLGTPPENTSSFVCLVLFFSLSETLSRPLVTAMLATGSIRNFQLVVGGVQMLNLPISYICLRYGLPPESVFVTSVLISIFCVVLRIYMLRNKVEFSLCSFFRNVFLNVFIVMVASFILPIVIKLCLEENIFNMIICCITSVISSVISIFFFGCNKYEQIFLKKVFRRFYQKIFCCSDD